MFGKTGGPLPGAFEFALLAPHRLSNEAGDLACVPALRSDALIGCGPTRTLRCADTTNPPEKKLRTQSFPLPHQRLFFWPGLGSETSAY